MSPTPIPATTAHHLIYDFYNNIPAHLTIWHGIPADEGVIPCTTPAGSCPGYQAALTVLTGRALYDVRLGPRSAKEAHLVLNSVRIEGIDS